MKDRISLPEEGKGNFVQIEIDNCVYFRSGGIEENHGEILRRALEEFGIKYSSFPKYVSDIGGFPVPNGGKSYQMVGAGEVEIQGDSIVVSGKSTNYASFPHRESLGELEKFLSGKKFR